MPELARPCGQPTIRISSETVSLRLLFDNAPRLWAVSRTKISCRFPLSCSGSGSFRSVHCRFQILSEDIQGDGHIFEARSPLCRHAFLRGYRVKRSLERSFRIFLLWSDQSSICNSPQRQSSVLHSSTTWRTRSQAWLDSVLIVARSSSGRKAF